MARILPNMQGVSVWMKDVSANLFFYNEFPFLKIKFNIPEEEHCILKMEANPL